jgi:hypothetical protein
MTSVPDITRLLARIHEWQEGHGKPGGRADAVHRLDEANKLLEEIANMLTEMRREMLGPATRDARPGVIDGATLLHWFLGGMPGFLILGLCIARIHGPRPTPGGTDMMAKLIAVVGVREAFGQG